MAFHGAHVVMACRDIESGQECKERILDERPKVKVEVMKVDLASLSSVQSFAEHYKKMDW